MMIVHLFILKEKYVFWTYLTNTFNLSEGFKLKRVKIREFRVIQISPLRCFFVVLIETTLNHHIYLG